jgi:hypothetical protein
MLAKRIAKLGGMDVATLTKYSKGSYAPEDAIDPVSAEKLALVQEEIGDRCAVIKTHGARTPAAARLVDEGRAQVFVSYRDLRDVTLSLIDHGARTRAAGGKDFAEFLKPRDSITMLTDAVSRMQTWMTDCNPLLVPYDEVAFDTRTTVARIAERLGVHVSVEEVLDAFKDKQQSIIQFNKGIKDRYKSELDEEDSQLFLTHFHDFYEKYYPEALVEHHHA